MSAIILFDGVCNFCEGSVQFIIKRDKAAYFQFASIQSKIGQELLSQFKVPTDIDSVILIEQGKAYTESTAALKISRHLNRFWFLCYPLILLPRFIRDFFYRVIAKNRYRLFGKSDTCMLPTATQRHRFL